MVNGITSCATGRITSPPELKYSAGGKPFAVFNMAVDDAKRGEGDPTDWLRVACFGELAETMNGKLVKGARCYVEGRLRLEHWTSQDGQQRASLKLSAWVLTPLGLESRRPRPDGPQEPRSVRQAASGPRRMPEAVAVHGTRVPASGWATDADDDLQRLPF